MGLNHVSRRQLIGLLAPLLCLPSTVFASPVIDLGWEDLLPEDQPFVPNGVRGLIDHEGPDLSRQQPASTGMRTDWNDQTVRLPGFVVPIDQRSDGVIAFILVPYVGACIHVPPPPANQLVFVTTEDPYDSSGLFEPVTVTGVLRVSSISTDLAQVGYSLAAQKVEPYEG